MYNVFGTEEWHVKFPDYFSIIFKSWSKFCFDKTYSLTKGPILLIRIKKIESLASKECESVSYSTNISINQHFYKCMSILSIKSFQFLFTQILTIDKYGQTENRRQDKML